MALSTVTKVSNSIHEESSQSSEFLTSTYIASLWDTYIAYNWLPLLIFLSGHSTHLAWTNRLMHNQRVSEVLVADSTSICPRKTQECECFGCDQGYPVTMKHPYCITISRITLPFLINTDGFPMPKMLICCTGVVTEITNKIKHFQYCYVKWYSLKLYFVGYRWADTCNRECRCLYATCGKWHLKYKQQE